MYVLALENGYQIVEAATSEGGFPSIIEDISEIVPYGQIIIDSYNRRLEEYLNGGGNIEDVKKAHSAQSKGHIILIKEGNPVPPMMLSPTAETDYLTLSEDLSDIDDTQYFKLSYRSYRGNITPVFQVDSLSKLYMYDLFQIRKNLPKRIRICENCGKAFSGEGKTNAIYCDDCKHCIKENKQRNRKGTPYKAIFDKIRDRRNGKARSGDDKTYKGYYNNLCIYRDRMEAGERKNIEKGDYSVITECIIALEAWDTAFFNLCKFYRNEDNNKVMAKHLDHYEKDREEWNKVKARFPLSIDNPAAWLNEWIDRQNAVSYKQHITQHV